MNPTGAPDPSGGEEGLSVQKLRLKRPPSWPPTLALPASLQPAPGAHSGSASRSRMRRICTERPPFRRRQRGGALAQRCPPSSCAVRRRGSATRTHMVSIQKGLRGRRDRPPHVPVTQPMIIRLIQSLLSSAAQGSSRGRKFIPPASLRKRNVDETGTAGGLSAVTGKAVRLLPA